MTDPLSPEEIEEKRAVPEDYGAIGLSRGTYFRLLDIAEDHARFVAENAKLRERVEKLEAVKVAARRYVRSHAGQVVRLQDAATATAYEEASRSLDAALAACEEEEGS